MNQKTLVFLIDRRGGRILLAMKKRGFGAGKWNGVGGKVEEGESVRDAAARETLEEISVVVDPAELLSRGIISFSFEGKPELTQDVHVFFAERWQGEPRESEEMRPRWYAFDAIPYDDMWIDDRYWLPTVLSGTSITARFRFNTAGDAVLESEITERPPEAGA